MSEKEKAAILVATPAAKISPKAVPSQIQETLSRPPDPPNAPKNLGESIPVDITT